MKFKDDHEWAKDAVRHSLFEIAVNIKAVNSGLSPKYFIDIETPADWQSWCNDFKYLCDSGWLA